MRPIFLRISSNTVKRTPPAATAPSSTAETTAKMSEKTGFYRTARWIGLSFNQNHAPVPTPPESTTSSAASQRSRAATSKSRATATPFFSGGRQFVSGSRRGVRQKIVLSQRFCRARLPLLRIARNRKFSTPRERKAKTRD